MRKFLLAGSALTVLSLAGAAHASSPIKLELGGDALWLFGVATQDKDFKKGQDYSSTDIKGNNFVYIDGSTMLDNGMKVGFHASFRAGGNSNTQHNEDPIDQSWVYAEGRLGKVLIGTNDNNAYLLHVSAPDAAGLSEDAGLSLLSGRWVGAPDGLYYLQTTAIDVTGSAEKIMYFSPKMAGFTLSAGFTPGSSNNGDEDYTQGNRDLGVANETYTLGLNYMHEFSDDLRLEASLGWQTGQGLHALSAFGNYTGDNIDTYNDYSGGVQVGYQGFTFGGGLRYQETETKIKDDKVETLAWTIGAQYDFDPKIVPLAVSLNYFNSEAKFKLTDLKDKVHNANLSANYELGTGVNWVSTLGYIKYESDYVDVGENEGIAAITGLSLSF